MARKQAWQHRRDGFLAGIPIGSRVERKHGNEDEGTVVPPRVVAVEWDDHPGDVEHFEYADELVVLDRPQGPGEGGERCEAPCDIGKCKGPCARPREHVQHCLPCRCAAHEVPGIRTTGLWRFR